MVFEHCQGSGEWVALAGAPQDGAVGGCQLQQCHRTVGRGEAVWYKAEGWIEARQCSKAWEGNLALTKKCFVLK